MPPAARLADLAALLFYPCVNEFWIQVVNSIIANAATRIIPPYSQPLDPIVQLGQQNVPISHWQECFAIGSSFVVGVQIDDRV